MENPFNYESWSSYLAFPESHAFRREAEIYCNQWDNAKRSAYHLWCQENGFDLPSHMKSLRNFRGMPIAVDAKVRLDAMTEIDCLGDQKRKVKIIGINIPQQQRQQRAKLGINNTKNIKKNKFYVQKKQLAEHIIID